MMAKTSESSKHAVVIYTRYERFWHWSQAALIFFLAFTGFNLHGSFDLLPFGLAVKLHTFAAIALILLWIFTTFWKKKWCRFFISGEALPSPGTG